MSAFLLFINNRKGKAAAVNLCEATGGVMRAMAALRDAEVE
jgi:hypothetical protein